jgi:hypothetical protein
MATYNGFSKQSRDTLNYLANNPSVTNVRQALRMCGGPEIGIKDTTLARASNATLSADPDLVVNVIAGVPYYIWAKLYVTTAATPGFQLNQAGGTAVASLVRGFTKFVTAAGAATTVIDVTALNTAQSPTAAAFVLVEFEGNAVFSTGGTLAINWSQKASNGTAAQVLSQSFLSVEPMIAMIAR